MTTVDRAALRVRTSGPEFPLLLVLLAAGCWVWSRQAGGPADRFPAALAAFATFGLVQAAVPRVRWSPERVFGPGNIALALFAVQLVVVPVLFVTVGPAAGELRVMPHDDHLNAALLIGSAAYAAYAVGAGLPTPRVGASRLVGGCLDSQLVGVAFVLVGGVGLVLEFPSPSDLVAYFSGAGDVFVRPGPSTLAEAAASFMRPFLPFGLVLLAAARIVRRSPARVRPVEVLLVALAVAASATYDYNRASAVVPVLALLTAYACTVRRIRLAGVVAVVGVVLFLAYQFGEYRSVYTATQGGRITAEDAGILGPGAGFADTLQVYANGAQFLAAVVQETTETGFRGGDTLVGSAMLPVPVLGEPFRETTGPPLYNELLYGRSGIDDQILGLGAELYWNLGLPGVLGGYALLGLAVRRFDDLLARAGDPLAAFTWSYCGIWTALLIINSISVISQIIVYFAWPVVGLVLVERLRRQREVRA